MSSFPRAAASALLTVALVLAAAPGGATQVAADDEELGIALSLAELLRAARTVVAERQHRINDPERTEPAFSGEEIVEASLARLEKAGSVVPDALDDGSRRGRYLALQAEAIAEVIDDNRDVIDQPGVGFKGFVPAVFARLVNERFGEKAGGEARLKVTAPLDLVRNRRARPDAWERGVIDERFRAADWPRGERHVETTMLDGREAFRVMVPEYYGEGCLACHGGPAGELDVTGYPKEGAELDALGGAISIALFR